MPSTYLQDAKKPGLKYHVDISATRLVSPVPTSGTIQSQFHFNNRKESSSPLS